MKIYAHRGIHGGIKSAENRQKAVKKALESSADGVELDLQLTADGDFLLFHDNTIKPRYHSSEYPRPVNSITKTEINTCENDFLFLKDLREMSWNGKQVILECKPSRNRTAYARRLIKRLSGFDSERALTLSSQDMTLLNELLLRCGLPLAPVIHELDALSRRYLRMNWWDEIHLDVDLCDKNCLDRTTGLDPSDVIVWTVNDPSRVQQLERMGIKGIMTDNQKILSGDIS